MTRRLFVAPCVAALAALVALPNLPLLPAPAASASAAVASTAVASASTTEAGGPKTTSIVRSADARSTTVLVHGLGDADTERARENRPRRHSDLQPTGRFVKKGETLTITVPAGAPVTSVGIGLYGLFAAHNDGIDVGIKQTALKTGVNTVVAPVDGMVTLISKATSGSAEVEVAGGQAVPTFITGQTTKAAFDAELARFSTAPFIEVIADRIFGDFQNTATGQSIKGDDLEKRTKSWDKAIAVTNDVYGLADNGTGTARKASQRIYITSPDSGAGYASATNERITFQVDTGAARSLFAARIGDNWGLWHEIGHTYQSPSYGFRGTSEMTVNISSLAVQAAFDEPAWMDSDAWQAQIAAYFATPIESRDYRTVEHSSTGLLMFEQLRRGFGPSFFSHLHQELRVGTALGEVKVVDDDTKEQALALYAAKVANRDLRPFFEQWGFPLSTATYDAMAKLPPLTAKIWQNSHTSKLIVDHDLPAYTAPVGTLAPITESVTVGQEHLVTAPRVTGLGNSDGSNSAKIVDARAKSLSVGPAAGSIGAGAGTAIVTLGNDRGVREILTTPLDSTAGNSIKLLGQSNRPVAHVALDPKTSLLRFISATSYSAHTSWAGKEYLALLVYTPEGRLVKSTVLNGDVSAQKIAAEADRQPYADGQYVVIRHQQASSGVFQYIDDQVQPTRADTTQAFRLEKGRFTSVPMSTIPTCDDSCAPTLSAPERTGVDSTATVSGSHLVPGEKVTFRVDGEIKAKDVIVDAKGTARSDIRFSSAGVHTIGLDAPVSTVSLERNIVVGDDSSVAPVLRTLVFGPTGGAGDSTFTGVTATSDGRSLQPSAAGSRSDALAFAATVKMPPNGASGPLLLPDNRCLVPTVSSTGQAIVGIADCTGDPAQRWQIGADGTIRSLDPAAAAAPWWSAHEAGKGSGDGSRVVTLGSSASVRLTEAAVSVRPVTATVGTVYPDFRWAELTGTATPGSEIRIGDQRVAASPTTGAWQTTVKDLALGDNDLDVRQFIGGHESGSTKVTAKVGTPGPKNVIAPAVDTTFLHSDGLDQVPFVLETQTTLNSLTATVELTAPEGTTFVEQADPIAEFQKKGATTWTKSAAGTLKNGILSADGTTWRYDVNWSGSSTRFDPEMKVRWNIFVETPEGAASREAAMHFVVSDPRPGIGFHVDAQAPVQIDPPGLVAGTPPLTELKRDDVTEVPVIVRNTIQRSSMQGTVTLTAPKGTQFVEQSTIAGSYRRSGIGAWTPWSVLDLKNGTMSADRTTLTLDLNTGTGQRFRFDEDYRYLVKVTTPTDAPAGDSGLGFRFEGTSNVGAFLAEGMSKTHLDSVEAPIAPPTVTAPAAGSTVDVSRPTFAGTGEPGAKITFGYNAKALIGSTTVNDQGTWTMNPSAGLALGTSKLIVTQTADTDVQTADYTINRVAAEQAFKVTSHADNGVYTDGVATFRGTSGSGAAIKAVNQWGTVMGTTTADSNGTWAFSRVLGPTTAGYDITFTATKGGTTETQKLHLDYQGDLGLQIVSPAHGSDYAVGNTTFTGKAAPNATITAVNQWGTPMGTATASLAGDWSFIRYLGPTTDGYDITVTATKGADTQRSLVHLNYKPVNVPVAVTSIKDGATYTPGENILKGTGTPGAAVSAVNATNGWNVPMGSAKVDANGTWALPSRNWGPANDYQIKVTQVNPDKTTSTVTVNVKAPR